MKTIEKCSCEEALAYKKTLIGVLWLIKQGASPAEMTTVINKAISPLTRREGE